MKALADDLARETFLRVHRARQSFVAGSAAMPWMFAIARNAFRHYVRRVTVGLGHGAKISRDRDAPAHALPETRGELPALPSIAADIATSTPPGASPKMLASLDASPGKPRLATPSEPHPAPRIPAVPARTKKRCITASSSTVRPPLTAGKKARGAGGHCQQRHKD